MRDFSIDLIWTKLQIACAALGGWLGYFLGGMDGLMIALIVVKRQVLLLYTEQDGS